MSQVDTITDQVVDDLFAELAGYDQRLSEILKLLELFNRGGQLSDHAHLALATAIGLPLDRKLLKEGTGNVGIEQIRKRGNLDRRRHQSDGGRHPRRQSSVGY